MGEQTIERERLRDFVAGALLANGPMWVVSYALLSLGLRESHLLSGIILNLSAIACGGLAGSLVARKSGLDARRVGIVTGLSSYLLFALFLTLIGFRGGMIEETSSLTGFLIGSAIGSKLLGKHQSSLVS